MGLQQQQTIAAAGTTTTALRHIIVALTVAAVVAVMMALTASTAFAAASDKANQVGKQTSGVNQSDPLPGRGGHVARDAAQDNGSSPGLGDIARYGRSNI